MSLPSPAMTRAKRVQPVFGALGWRSRRSQQFLQQLRHRTGQDVHEPTARKTPSGDLREHTLRHILLFLWKTCQPPNTGC